MCFLQIAAQRSLPGTNDRYRFHSFLEMRSLVTAPFDWNALETFDQDATLDFLSYLYNRKDSTEYFWLEKYNPYDDSSYTLEAFSAYHVPYVHLIDLDRDKDLDIVYEGYQMPGYNTKTTMVFIRHKKQYLETLSEDGIVVGLNEIAGKKKKLIVFHYPCCTEYTESLKVIEFSKPGKTTVIQQTEAIGFTGITNDRLNELAVFPLPPMSFAEIGPDSAYIFNTPEPDYLENQEKLLSDQYLFDEYAAFLAHCGAGTNGRVLDQYTDEEGNLWYFMEVPFEQPNKPVMFEYAFYDQTLKSFAGWIPVEKCSLKIVTP